MQQNPKHDSDVTEVYSRKSRTGRSSLLQDALNAVDAALNGDSRQESLDIENEEARVEALAASLSGSKNSSANAGSRPVQPQVIEGHRMESEAQILAQKKLEETPGTQRVRGRPEIPSTEFHQEPVVGWLVIVDGPGLGSFRIIIEGNNSIGWAPNQHIRLDFGDDSISAEEQAFIRYDSVDCKFLFVPNLTKTNVVWVNDDKPTSAIELKAMDIITMGRTRVVFVPFCGNEFDWSELRK